MRLRLYPIDCWVLAVINRSLENLHTVLYYTHMSTQAQRNYIGSLLYKAGMGWNNAGKVQEFCEELTDTEASTIIGYIKVNGLEGLDMYDQEEEIVPERIKDILSLNFSYDD